MAYEDPIEAALRSLTDVEWKKRKDCFEARTNQTHKNGILLMLGDHRIEAQAEVSAERSGRYIITVAATELSKILKAVEATGATVKPHRRKWNN